ncbi:transposable element Tcb1 transposase [Trichonephila clavipes]|nr:transposable element Tcb1 transposase [Trichonephila clavipes]
MSRRKQRSAFDQVSEFDRRRIVAYRDCGLSFREIGSRVGRNLTTVMRICDRWIQEGTTDRRGRSHPPQCTTSLSARTIRHRLQQSLLSARRPLLSLPLTRNHRRLRRQWCDKRRIWAAEWNEVVFTDESRICLQYREGRIRVWRHRGERMLNSCVMHRTLVLHRVLWAWPQPYFNRIMRDHMWHALSKGSSSITRLNSFPGRLALRIFRRWKSCDPWLLND